jgi:FkbM family methyltransferase
MPYPSSGGSFINRIIVDEYFRDVRDGFFIESGACDGIFQSNTYYLETELNWSGLLIEPNPDYVEECIFNRPKSKVYSCALVSPDYQGDSTVLYSIACKGAMGTVGDRGIWINESETPVVHENIPVKTLTSILDEIQPPQINFMSLDVEGYELNVLQGLDLEKYKPEVIVVECHGELIREVDNILSIYYNLDNKISDIDYVYLVK